MSTKKIKKTKNEKPQSIECKEAEIKAKKIVAYDPEIHPILNELIYPYKLERGARAQILAELNPKCPKIDANAKLDQGDVIAGIKLDCITTEPIAPALKQISGSHRGKYAIAKDYVYCKVLVAHSK